VKTKIRKSVCYRYIAKNTKAGMKDRWCVWDTHNSHMVKVYKKQAHAQMEVHRLNAYYEKLTSNYRPKLAPLSYESLYYDDYITWDNFRG